MDKMKSRISAIDDLIERCEEAIARPGKVKRMSLKAKTQPEEPKGDEDVLDKKAKLSNMLDELDEDELMELYSKLED
jgi:hypothetical protein